MAVESTIGIDISRLADVDLSGSQYRVVVYSATGCALPSGVTNVPLGILQNAPTAGQVARIRIYGGSKVAANAAFTAGDALSIAATSGRVDTAATTHYPVGRALTAATAQDELADMIVMPMLVPLA